jgi:hypothetical protein|tara:strand:- start:672 stop:872 length:201 start_codon:yes stop_codon:yes gene_type:complete
MAVKDKKGKVDTLLERFTSRKLLVWLTCTALLLVGQVTGDTWETLSIAYVGTQAFVDATVAWKHGK